MIAAALAHAGHDHGAHHWLPVLAAVLAASVCVFVLRSLSQSLKVTR